MVTRFRGSVLHKALPFSLFSGTWALVLGYALKVKENEYFQQSYTYQVFSFCVGFALIFRTQISYGRYWESCTHLHNMR